MALLAILLVSYCDGLEEIPGIMLLAELLGMFEGSQAHGFTLIRVMAEARFLTKYLSVLRRMAFSWVTSSGMPL